MKTSNSRAQSCQRYWLPPLLAVALLAGCRSSPISMEVPKVPGVTPYRMVIQQGNFVSSEMVAQLKPGMTKEQVRFVLGTPLVNDIFHADRWDYVFFREMPDGKKEQRNLSVIFEKDRLARVLGDLMPAQGQTQSGGFEPLIKPDNDKPAAKAAAKPPAEEPKAAAAPPSKLEGPTTQNWGTASDQSKQKPEAAAAKEEPKPANPDENKERGFFGRMLEKIGL
jgi:outer membrane protein assembly factor BamE